MVLFVAAAVSFCLSVAISVAAAAVLGTPSGLAMILGNNAGVLVLLVLSASAAANFCLSVAISAAAVAVLVAAVVRSTIMTLASRDRADRALLPSGLAMILGNNAGLPWVTGMGGPAGGRAAVRKAQSDRAARVL